MIRPFFLRVLFRRYSYREPCNLMLRPDQTSTFSRLLAGSGGLNHISKKKAVSGNARPYNKFKYAPQMQEAWINGASTFLISRRRSGRGRWPPDWCSPTRLRGISHPDCV